MKNTAILLVVLQFFLLCIDAGDDKPVFPKTYHTTFSGSLPIAKDALRNEGIMAEYYEKELAIIEYNNEGFYKIGDDYPTKIIFNQKLFLVTGSKCQCFNKNYTELGFPYLASFKNLKLYEKNTTYIYFIEETINNPFLLHIIVPYFVLFGLSAGDFNIPLTMEFKHEKFQYNISFPRFVSAAPDLKLFTIPQNCLQEYENQSCQ